MSSDRCGVDLDYAVIIPTIGRPSLEQSIRSVLAQTKPAAQIIIVGDGHDNGDRARCIVASILDPSGCDPVTTDGRESCPDIMVVSVDHRGQPAPARNTGLAEVRTPLVALLDDDDVWQPTKMAEQLSRFEETTNEGVVAVGSNATVVGDGDHRLYFDDPPTRARWTDFLRRNPLITSTVVIRTDVLRDVGGFPLEPYLLDDYACWLRLATRGDVAVIPTPLATYRAPTIDSTSRILADRGRDSLADCLHETRRWLRTQTSSRRHRVEIDAALLRVAIQRRTRSIRHTIATHVRSMTRRSPGQ